MKAIKNATELKNTRIAHLKDGVAVTKFMYWLKTHVGKEYITEYTAGKYLDSLRAQQENFLDLSFDNISAYGANAAMMHYSAKEETAGRVKTGRIFTGRFRRTLLRGNDRYYKNLCTWTFD